MNWSGLVEDFRRDDEHGMDMLCGVVSDYARTQLMQSMEWQSVDDHVQEVLIIVLGAIRNGELRNADCLMGFVRTVARRQATIHIRRAILRRRRMISVESANPPPAPASESPEARLATRQRIAALDFALKELCARDREILVRFYFEEQDSRQICTAMNLTSTQFRLYKSRALIKCSVKCNDERGELSVRFRRIQSTRPLRIA